mmetsp:Transcript_27043/g.84982  ORF Transcript_27043/g.84982 Transcript_27043/m.84982 type:complete len:368 (-) Transcript_27043:1058-2161(-)
MMPQPRHDDPSFLGAWRESKVHAARRRRRHPQSRLRCPATRALLRPDDVPHDVVRQGKAEQQRGPHNGVVEEHVVDVDVVLMEQVLARLVAHDAEGLAVHTELLARVLHLGEVAVVEVPVVELVDLQRREAVLEERRVVEPEEVVLDLVVGDDIAGEEDQRDDGRRHHGLRLCEVVGDGADGEAEANADAGLQRRDRHEVAERPDGQAQADEEVHRQRHDERVDAHEDAVRERHGEVEAGQGVGAVAVLAQQQRARRWEGQRRLHHRVHHRVDQHHEEDALRREDAVLRVPRLVDPDDADEQAHRDLDYERLQVLLRVLGHIPKGPLEKHPKLPEVRRGVRRALLRALLVPNGLAPDRGAAALDIVL